MTFDWLKKMDFIGFAYSALVTSGGVFGYIKAQSVPSLVAGLAFGSLLAGGAYLTSMDPPKPSLQLATATILGSIMGYRFYNSHKFMPAGIITLVSVAVILRDLFVYNRYLPFMKKE